MTEINGLRLAYRGLVMGLAGSYVWLAAAMLISMAGGDALVPLRLIGALWSPQGEGLQRDWLLLAMGMLQVAAAGIGIAFAYFFARFFTIRHTLALAGPCFALLTWLMLSDRLTSATGAATLAVATQVALICASLLYGLVLGIGLPLRREVLRAS